MSAGHTAHLCCLGCAGNSFLRPRMISVRYRPDITKLYTGFNITFWSGFVCCASAKQFGVSHVPCAGSGSLLQCCWHDGFRCAGSGHVWCSRALAPAPSSLVLPEGILATGSDYADDRDHTKQLGIHGEGAGHAVQQPQWQKCSKLTTNTKQRWQSTPVYPEQAGQCCSCVQLACSISSWLYNVEHITEGVCMPAT